MVSQHCISEWRCRSLMLLAMVFPLLIAVGLSWYGMQQRPEPFAPLPLQPIVVNSAEELEAIFSRHDYRWPAQRVPALAVRSLPPDMTQLQVRRKKQLFFRTLLPLVVAENVRLRLEREWLARLARGEAEAQPERLAALAVEYRLDPELPRDALLGQLLLRVDEVPAGLVLAQAANESGWGTSRFSLEVNNLFGEWTWNAEQGVIPRQRPEDASHFVRRFDSLRESIRSYLHNLNSGGAYRELRALRARMRQEGHRIDPLVLASGLERYSARGVEYVQEIQAMIRGNGLNKLGQLDLVR